MPVRSFCESDNKKVLSLRDVAYSSLNLEQFRWSPCQQVESLDQDCLKFVSEEGYIKGYGAAYQLDETHFRLNLLVHPEHRRQGVGSQLLNRIEEEVLRRRRKYLQARAFESMPASLKFLLARGFAEVHTMRGLSLRASGFSIDKWQPLGQRLAARGFVLTTLKDELDSNANPIDKLAQLYEQARKDWPSPDPTWQPNTSSENLRAPFESIKHPEYFSIAKHKDQYVGFTSAKNLASGTAVHPAYRNLGIATYLKAFDINRCIAAGEDYFESATANSAMQRVNEKLGYRLNGLAEVRFVKEFHE